MTDVALSVHDAIVPDANGAVPFHQEGTNFPLQGFEFDTAQNDEIYWEVPIKQWAGSGDWTMEVHWYNNGTGTTGNAIFGVSVSAITANTDTQDVETDGLDTEDTFTDAHLGTTAQRQHLASWTIENANLDGAADDDVVRIRLRLLSTSTVDGPVRVTSANLIYTAP